jgi:hypothetical protein
MKRGNFISRCIILALEIFWGIPPGLYGWIHLYFLGVSPHFFPNHKICFDMFFYIIYNKKQFTDGTNTGRGGGIKWKKTT